jgi:hypothetical protein
MTNYSKLALYMSESDEENVNDTTGTTVRAPPKRRTKRSRIWRLERSFNNKKVLGSCP